MGITDWIRIALLGEPFYIYLSWILDTIFSHECVHLIVKLYWIIVGFHQKVIKVCALLIGLIGDSANRHTVGSGGKYYIVHCWWTYWDWGIHSPQAYPFCRCMFIFVSFNDVYNSLLTKRWSIFIYTSLEFRWWPCTTNFSFLGV